MKAPPGPPPSSPARARRLDSWKEIASYLKRGARTVQRWEREEGLPVHRLSHEKLGSVYAYPEELDRWWAARGSEPEKIEHAAPSLAVLPFADMSQEQDQGYFCEGIAEEIINALTRVKGMRVASRTSSFQFRAAGLDSREIGRRLRVSALLEGSVRKLAGRLRIAVQLADASTGFQLWSSRYDREVRDIFAIQDEISRSIVAALQVTLTPREEERLSRPPTRDVTAYDCYLRGRKFYYQYGARDMEFALRLFSRAVELDPAYPGAYAGLADCWSYLYLYHDRSEANRQNAERAGLKAVALDPESAQAHASNGLALSLSGRNEEAEAAFETAARLDPGLFEAHYFHARHCFALGQSERAVEFYERAIAVRPEDYQAHLLVAQSYDDLGQSDKARAARLCGVDLAGRHLELNPDDTRAMYAAANGLAALGEAERARSLARRALDLRPDDPMVLYNVGCVFSLLGMPEPALECLEKAARSGLKQRGWYDHDSNLDPLRGDPRFLTLLQSL